MIENIPTHVDNDAVTNKAIEAIISIYIEGGIYNKDHLGYWSILNHHLIEISTYSFRAGLNDFYQAIEANPNSKELVAYHLRTMTRLMNTDSVRESAERLYDNFATNCESYRTGQASFDLTHNNLVSDISILNKILFFIHIYSDIITISTVLEKEKIEKSKPIPRKFKVT